MCKIDCEGKLFVCGFGKFTKIQSADNIEKMCQRYEMHEIKCFSSNFQPLKLNNIKNCVTTCPFKCYILLHLLTLQGFEQKLLQLAPLSALLTATRKINISLLSLGILKSMNDAA